MEDAFSYRAGRLPRRRLDPLAFRAAVAAGIVVAVTGAFAKVAIDSERRSFQDVRPAPDAIVGTISGADDLVPAGSQIEALPTMDDPARAAAEVALAAAQRALTRGSLTGAGPAQMARLDTGLIFVEGPSTAPEVVSLSISGKVWGAAVMGASGTCYYVRLDADGTAAYGTGLTCVGDAARSAVDPAWGGD